MTSDGRREPEFQGAEGEQPVGGRATTHYGGIPWGPGKQPPVPGGRDRGRGLSTPKLRALHGPLSLAPSKGRSSKDNPLIKIRNT